MEEAGHTTIIQAWDFRPGGNFVLDMQKAAADAERTIAVLSLNYLKALYTQPEWAAAFAQDPTGAKKTLLPVRVQVCELKGMLSQIVYIDLVGLAEQKARRTLLAGLSLQAQQWADLTQRDLSEALTDALSLVLTLLPVTLHPEKPVADLVDADVLQMWVRQSEALAEAVRRGLRGPVSAIFAQPPLSG